MTDKQIIIDGVNVSGCYQYMHRYMEDYDIDTLDYCRYHFRPCKDVDVKYCYYKQLKRKEQELRTICKEFDIEYIIDKETGSLICRCNKLNKKEQECEELKKKLQAQRAFTAQEQRKIYCVAYDKTCETGNECKQKKCVFKDRLKYKQALDEIEEYLDAQQKYFDGEDYHNLLDIINKAKKGNNNG